MVRSHPNTKNVTFFLNKIRFMDRLPYLLIGLMLIPITFFSRWGPIDDWGLLEYLIGDIPRTQIISTLAISGRFFPLYWIEWYTLSNISINPYLFYSFNFIEALIACYLLYDMCKSYTNKRISTFLVFLLILSPAFVASFYRLGVPDKNAFLLFTIGLYFILKYLYSNHQPKTKYLHLFLAFLVINLALYFKEPGFILISVFSTVFALLNYFYNKEWYKQNRKLIFTILIFSLISSFIFLLLYMTNVNLSIDQNYVTSHTPDSNVFNRILQSMKSLIWFTFSDPLIIFIGPVVLFLRIIKRKDFAQKINDHTIKSQLFLADSALFAALCYAVFYITLALINYHYLLSAYAFLLPAIAIYIDILMSKKIGRLKLVPKSANLRKFIILILSLLLIGSTASGINQMVLLKYVPYNMNEFLDNGIPIIKSDLDKKPFDEKINFFLLGVDRRQYIELYHSVPAYFKMRDIDITRIDIKSVDPVDDNFQSGGPLGQYTAFQTKDIQIPESGDYIIIIPYARRDEITMIESLKEKHNIELEQLYATKNTYFFQLPFPIQIMRHVAKEAGLYKSGEIFYWTAGYSLYIVK